MLAGIVSRLRPGTSLLGIVALSVSPLPLHAAGIISTAVAPIDGIVVSATDTTLVIHPPIGSDVTLTLADKTRIRPHGQPMASAPSAGSLVGQYAHALYDLNTLIAGHVVLRPPVPLPAVGLVHEASAEGFSLMLRDGRLLSLIVDARTTLRLNGRPATSSQLGTGDRVEALFLLESSANRALRVNAQKAPMGLPVRPDTSPGKPDNRPGKPQPLPSKPQNLPGKPETLPGKPQNLPGKPQTLPGKPGNLPGKLIQAPGKPTNLPGKPQNLPGKPETFPGKPANLPRKPQTQLGKPANLPGKPQNLPGKPGTARGKPKNLIGKPANLPMKPQLLPRRPDTLPGKLQTLPDRAVIPAR